MTNGIFVTARNHLEGTTGGVQICTREYVDVIKAAGIQLRFCLAKGDHRIWTRILRRLMSPVYFRPTDPRLIDEISYLAAEITPDFIFLNQVALAGLGAQLRSLLPPSCKIVVLSHGLESTDLLHLIRLRSRLPLTFRVRPIPSIALGHAILTENAMRQYVDLVCALSPSDVELERWIGASRVGWLPRIVEPKPIDWHPLGTRLGFVGTLDHAPNLEGLVAVLDQLAEFADIGNLRIRVVGSPGKTGAWLANKYPSVDYLGQLDDGQLRIEATTWNGFIHPIFCSARGCSTKLATAIAWCIPVITTAVGHRGYDWSEGGFIVAENPSEFAVKCIELLNDSKAKVAREEIAKLARTSPSRDQVAAKFRELLNF
jgi:glycosyltransferase involved in cell wall biosynthesis